MRTWALSIAMLLGWAAIGQATPIDFKDVPADAKWLAHVDVDAMRDSTLVVRAYDHLIAEHPEVEDHFHGVEHLSGMDPRSDLHSLTFYGTKLVPKRGVLIVRADVDKERLLEKAEGAPGHKVSEYGDYQVHTWLHKRKRGEQKVSGAFFKPDVLVFGSRVQEVKRALDVLAGKKKNLADGESALAVEVPAGTMFLARVLGLTEAKLPAKSPVLKKIEQIGIATGEHEDEGFLQATLIAEDQQTAEEIQTVIEGGRAMIMLQHGEDPDVKALMRALDVDVSDRTVSVEFRAGVDRIWQAAEKAAEEMKTRPGKHGRKKHKENHDKQEKDL